MYVFNPAETKEYTHQKQHNRPRLAPFPSSAFPKSTNPLPRQPFQHEDASSNVLRPVEKVSLVRKKRVINVPNHVKAVSLLRALLFKRYQASSLGGIQHEPRHSHPRRPRFCGRRRGLGRFSSFPLFGGQQRRYTRG